MQGATSLVMTIASFALIAVTPAVSQTPPIVNQTRLFLDAYARGDRTTVLSFVEETVTVYGSDVAEIVHGRAALEKMITDDHRLWGDTAHIGLMEHISVIEGKGLASIFFDAPFSAGGQSSVPVRFALTWRHSRKGWQLVQSSNVVPTQGQSATDLLNRSTGQKSP